MDKNNTVTPKRNTGVRIAPIPSFTMRLPDISEWRDVVEALNGDLYNELFWKDIRSYFTGWDKDWVNSENISPKKMLPEDSILVQTAGMTSALNLGCCNNHLKSGNIGFRPAFVPKNPDLIRDMKDGDKMAVGTLYMNGVPIKRPIASGCVKTEYRLRAKLTLGPLAGDSQYHMLAVKIGNVLICDRPMIIYISYAELCKALPPSEKELSLKLGVSVGLTKQELDKVISGNGKQL